MQRKQIFIFFYLIINHLCIYAQTGTIRGFVYDKETGEPIIFTNVYLKGTTLGSATDINGYYNISKVPQGTYTLVVTCIGYDTLKQTITIKGGEILTQKLFIQRSPIKLEPVTISAEKQEAVSEVKVSVIKITPKEISYIPTISGEPDFAQYLQILPGVIFTGDQGGQLYIRGGPPIQNKVLLDGMTIYNPFHSIGLFSVFDADIIRNTDVLTGGFNAEYGGRISSIMDITTRDGNKKRFSGKISVNPFLSTLLLEGPVRKQSTDDKATSSFIFSARTSYLDQSSKYLYTYIDTGGLPYNFTDFYGKISTSTPRGSKINLFGFNFTDRVNYREVSDFHWNALGIGSNFILIPEGSHALIQGFFSYSSYNIFLEEKAIEPRFSEINGFNGGLNFTYFIGKNELKYGFETSGYKTDFSFINSVNRKITQKQYSTELSGFIKYKIVINKLLLEPGFRAQYYGPLFPLSPEPRLGAKYNLKKNLRLKFSGGLYSQNLISAVSDRDVVNLFYGFLSGPVNLPSQFKGEDVKHSLQKAEHLVLGFEYDLFNRVNINVEGYYKNFSQLINLNRRKIFDDTGDNADKPDLLKKDFIVENGYATGCDFLLRYNYKQVFFWMTYSLGFSRRSDGVEEYPPHFDRRHNINLVCSYTFGKAYDWALDVRWNIGSGFPFTQTQGFSEYIDFQQGIGTDYTTINGTLFTHYARLNAGRLPYYHRLDVSIEKTFPLTTTATLNCFLNIINVYNRKNIFYINRITSDKVYQLPIMPSIGLTLKF